MSQVQRLLDMGHTIYISIDGARNFEDRAAQNLMISEISKFESSNRNKLRVRLSEENFGLSKSIHIALDWAFEFTSSLVILEDDIDFNSRFFDFATISLKRYESNESVLMISGNQFFERESPNNQVTSYPLIWGWATTKSKWNTMKMLKEKSLPSRPKGMSFKCYSYWMLGYLRVSNKELNSWVLPIAAQMRIGDYFCICPTSNLTSNLGDDDVATHTTSRSKGIRTRISEECLLETELKFDKTISAKIDKLLEMEIYQIKTKSILSLAAYRLMKKFVNYKC